MPELKSSDSFLSRYPLDKAIAKVYNGNNRQNRDMVDPDFDAMVLAEVLSAYSTKSICSTSDRC